MPISSTPLPYDRDALEPWISASTLEFHHGKHYMQYVAKLRALIEGTPMHDLPLEEIVHKAWKAGDLPLFNNAAQAWNHEFYFASLSADGDRPDGHIVPFIIRDFGGVEPFQNELIDAALSHFGSGWVWLVVERERLKVVTTANADSPLLYPRRYPIFVIDVWEHAYYLDYQNDKKRHVEAVATRLLNWRRINERFAAQGLSQDRASA
ncbi:MAG: superoxide dismutase [Pseudomonadales bacterium]